MRARSFSAMMLMSLVLEGVSADLCGMGSSFVEGNHYCQPVQRISYQGISSHGSYDKVTYMDPKSGTCSTTKQPFEGSPLDEDISLHFRGPLKLKQFAVFKPTSGNPSRLAKKSVHERRQGHAHFHEQVKEKRDAGVAEKHHGHQAHKRLVIVTQTLWETATAPDVVVWVDENGQLISQGGGLTPPTPAPQPVEQAINVPVAPPAPSPAPVPKPAKVPSAQVDAAPPNIKPITPPATVRNGDWAQVSYFNSEENVGRGVTFLGNHGGQGSGVFDMEHFGASLSYVSRDASHGAASPELFGGNLNSNQEVAIFSEDNCNNGGCDYFRPGSVAYKGFTGTQKAFFMEFMMPDDGQTGFNGNMPAIWALNAKIPRTQQYGSCSCWPACGEFDIFESLHQGSALLKSTLHGGVNGGDSDYFERPKAGYIKAAVIFHDDNIVVQQLPSDFDIKNASISAEQIFQMCDDSKATVKTSVMRLAKGN